MWGAFLSEPLSIAATVGRYPAVKLMERTPIPFRIAPLVPHPCGPGTPPGINPAFAGLAPGKGKVGYALLTRAPVAAVPDRNPARDAPRLACVRPVASVHPEPGSNSTLYNTIDLLFPRSSAVPPNAEAKLRNRTILVVCPHNFNDLFLISPRVIPESECKGTHFFRICKNWGKLFSKFFGPGTQPAGIQRNADEKK